MENNRIDATAFPDRAGAAFDQAEGLRKVGIAIAEQENKWVLAELQRLIDSGVLLLVVGPATVGIDHTPTGPKINYIRLARIEVREQQRIEELMSDNAILRKRLDMIEQRVMHAVEAFEERIDP